MISSWRGDLGWTQERAAKYLGVGYSLYSKLERGARIPSLTLAARIQEMAGVPAASWLKQRIEPARRPS